MENVTLDTPTTTAIGPDVNHPDRVTVEKLKVLHDYVVVRPLAPPSKKGLIHIAETSAERERSHRGVVLAVGAGDWNEAGTALVPMTIEAGDLVFFGKYAGTLEEFGGAEVLVMRERELRLAISEGRYQLVEHPEAPKLAHLVEDWCEVCHGKPLEEAAAAELARQREELVAANRVLPAAAPLRAVETVHEKNEDLIERMNQVLAETIPPAQVVIVEENKRPCTAPACSFMQRQAQTTAGLYWIGLLCGHVHQAGLVLEA
jgi:chaperonin GroES